MQVQVGIAASLLALAACYSPSAAVGVPCSAAGECPSGQRCDQGTTPPTCVAGDAPPVDAAPDAPPSCAAGASCPASAPICDASTETCRGCVADAECGDNVCVEHLGECVDAANALFVADTGADTDPCTRVAPCSLDHALSLVANNQRTIAMADGVYSGAVSIKSDFGANTLTLSGPDRDPAGVTIAGTVLVENTAKPVTIEGVTIQVSGLRAVDNRGALTLSRVVVTGASNGVVSTNPNTLRIWDSEIRDNQTIGVDVTQTSLELLRTVVSGNGGGGIDIRNAASTIESTVIAGNGSVFAAFGGVRFQNLNDKPQVFRFNTVASNASISGGAVTCGDPVALDSSIFTAASDSPLGAGCTATYSLFAATPPAGEGNVMGDPAFVGTDDFHIGPTSAARDAADPAASIELDIDGEVRPQGTARDIGADEIP